MLKFSVCALSQVVLLWWLQIISAVEFAVNPFVCHVIWFCVDMGCVAIILEVIPFPIFKTEWLHYGCWNICITVHLLWIVLFDMLCSNNIHCDKVCV